MRKPKVKQEYCTGDQVCITIAPYVFQMDDKGRAFVLDPEGADEEVRAREPFEGDILSTPKYIPITLYLCQLAGYTR